MKYRTAHFYSINDYGNKDKIPVFTRNLSYIPSTNWYMEINMAGNITKNIETIEIVVNNISNDTVEIYYS